MTDIGTGAGILLVVGPLVGAIPLSNPTLIPIWSMSPSDHIATVGRHRRAWAWLNAGFAFATILTTAGLIGYTQALGGDPGRVEAVGAATVAYAFGGALWCAVLAIRTRTTPALADLAETGTTNERRPALLDAATTGLFNGFVVMTGAALAALGSTLLVAGGIASPIAAFSVLVGLGAIAWLSRTGDVIPAVLYGPTLLLGVVLLVGWR